LFRWSLGSASGTVPLHCGFQRRDLAGWHGRRQPSLAGHTPQHLCQPPVASSLPASAERNLAPSGSGSAKHPLLLLCLPSHVVPSTFPPPLWLQGMMISKWHCVGEKPDRKPFFSKDLLSENLHSLFSKLMGNFLPQHLCRSAGDKVC